MSVAIDAGVLSQFLYEDYAEIVDFKTGKIIDHARERIDGLIQKIEKDKDLIIIPTPALSEALVVVAPDVQKYLDQVHQQSCFKIADFDERAAIEVALRAKYALTAGDKKEAVKSSWKKVKYDRQIVAIAKVEAVSVIYSADRFIHKHAELWGLKALNISELPILKRETQRSLPGLSEGQIAHDEKG